ncbi:L-serine ammonia-lyase, iron-sulfur-dependent, subunit beta [Enterococcus faecalis]|uniref:L-serine ammonia-lyase, iron-sulfur-dependent subunit beta n=1 Tax=Enterococcus faecalis TaxID=1351 RepID=UPI000534B902|nr:L-serine ammonia-lyase, iron-sulfur-dependent subunit beta [Enterococcus faecalis]EGS8063477.1 L-serine ammonia-lyase, iron-sulfur-dependent, subunit beta [Enterococcus faecalis]EGS8065472.1 L-serine ammonia-lyase, iron-sulfur-dependent, subunit beta [Enterococcus faecalis]EHZ5084546.1 L-serine ammonia-lyase, iron-sulfur-dependent subunit beta [Enterococcus faecalis]EHZ5086527.1 L-serine ammonia-lyase, iron-sulfur-dependent subunit beta [Enterococcus faecalis]EIM5404961.1 L-serine ammonia-l
MEELRFNSVFDIIGPVMIGPSSSHTAGAARIGKVVRSIFGQQPDSVDIYLYESFAKTYRGHGTDIALVGGLLGMEPDDEQLANSLEIAYEQGMEVFFIPKSEKADHPNSVKIVVSSGDRKLSVTGISIGGGNIQISELNGFKLSLSMGTPTFIVVHQDVPGMIAKVTNILSASDINISTMTVTRESKGEKAIMIIEVDQAEVGDIVMQLAEIPHIYSVNYFD